METPPEEIRAGDEARPLSCHPTLTPVLLSKDFTPIALALVSITLRFLSADAYKLITN